MRKLPMWSVVVFVTLALTGCSAEVPEGELRVPASSDSLDGDQAEEVVALFEAAGFGNVESQPLGDLLTGWLNDPGEVKEVEIEGQNSFSSSDTFPKEAKIVVFYHSFPDNEDPAAGEDSTPEQSPMDQALSVDNSPEFAAILGLGDYCSDEIASFAQTYEGRVIVFAGNIGAIANSGGSSTRFDILLGAGDYDENSQMGPAFQFKDVNIVSDLGLTGPGVPDAVAVGDNVLITAEIDSYEENSCLFLLDPVSTQYR